MGKKREEPKHENAIHSQRSLWVESWSSRPRSRRRCRPVTLPGRDRVVEDCTDEELLVLRKKRRVRELSNEM